MDKRKAVLCAALLYLLLLNYGNQRSPDTSKPAFTQLEQGGRRVLAEADDSSTTVGSNDSVPSS